MNGYVRKKSLRLKNYDYRQHGFYFITVCTYSRKRLFGRIENGVMRRNAAGEMVKRIWDEIPLFYKGFVLHEFVVMPNHIHGIIEIVGTTPSYLSDTNSDTKNEKQLSVSDLIHRFKTLTTSKYIDGVHHDHWEAFYKHIWQRSFHEHIVRNEKSYNQIVEYIKNNPLKWEHDCYFT